MAGGGGVEDDQVAVAGPLELLDLAQHEDVLDAGRGGGHDVERPGGHQAPGDPAHAVVLEVLEQGVVGGERAGPHVGRALGAAGRRRSRPRRSRGARRRTVGQARLALDLDDQGATDPARAAARASAALTVVLPTPPFPATMTQPGCCEELRRIHVPSPPEARVRRLADDGPRRCAARLARPRGRAPCAQDAGPRRRPGRRARGSGLLDPVLVDFISTSVAEAEDEGADGAGPPAEQPRRGRDRRRARRAARPDPRRRPSPSTSGSARAARAYGGRGQLVGVADEVGMAPGTRLGDSATTGWTSSDGEAFGGDRCDRHGHRRRGAATSASPTALAPTIGDFRQDLAGVRDRGHRRRRRRRARSPRSASASSRWCPSSSTPWPARRWPTCCFVHRPGPHHVRAVHRRRRGGRRRRRRAFILGVLRPGRPPDPLVGGRPHRAVAWSPSPSTCRPACPASGPASAS